MRGNTDGAPDFEGAKHHPIALALQGGGSHGVFTWGVLDRLLQEPDLDIIGVTGTSAGVMNAVVLADGLVRGGPAGARRRLRNFWETSSKLNNYTAFLDELRDNGSRTAADHRAAIGKRSTVNPPKLLPPNVWQAGSGGARARRRSAALRERPRRTRDCLTPRRAVTGRGAVRRYFSSRRAREATGGGDVDA